MKNQIKKSLSLLMAVLMILSCWVWVAPEKAEAAGETYWVRVTWNADRTGQTGEPSDDTNDDGSCIGFFIKSQESTVTADLRGGATNTDNEWKGSLTGFPETISVVLDHGSIFETANLYIKKIEIGNSETNFPKTVFNGELFLSSSTKAKRIIYNMDGTFTANDGDNAKLNKKSTATWELPYFKTVTKIEAADASVAKLGSNTDRSASIKVTGGKDQYDVEWAQDYPTSGFSYSLKYTNDNGDEVDLPSTCGTATGSGSQINATLKPDLQKLFPEKGTGRIKAYCTYSSGGTASATINLTFPNYTITFDGNGGQLSDDETTFHDKIAVTKDDKLYYNTVIGKSPADAVKPGFTLVGYYSKKNNDLLGISVDTTVLDPATYGTKYVDEGDNATRVSTQGDMTYYALWLSTPITATFMTADNQLIGTLEGRYNNNMVASNMYNGVTNLNKKLAANYTGNSIKFDGNGAPVYKDGSTTYSFSHWKIIDAYDESVVDGNENTILKGDVTFQAVYEAATAAKYSVYFYDGNGNTITVQDADGNNVGYNYYSFRDSVIVPSTDPTKAQDDRYDYKFIGWANRLVGEDGKQTGPNFYAVDENDNDADGAKIVYTSKDAAEFTVRGNASYVPVFRMIPREYTVTFTYTVGYGVYETVTVGGYHWGDTLVMPEEVKDNYTFNGKRYYIDGWKVGFDPTKKQLNEIEVNGDTDVTALYGAGVAAVYTINFYDKDGNLINADSNSYEHNSSVTVPTVGNTTEEDETVYDIPQIIDTEDSLYTFVKFNTKADGTGDKVATTATADADYYAVYTKQDYADVHFYNYDGTLIYKLDGKENSLFANESIIPAYENFVDGENILPSREADVVGTYNFTGWKDGSGKVVVPGTDKFTGDVYLTAQYETVHKNYTVKFLDDDGREIFKNTYHYGDAITVPADPTKEADETYTYDFRAWTPDVSEVCYGDATYTAAYRRTHNYYAVTWFKDNKTVISKSNYIYNAKIQQAIFNTPISYPVAETGHTWVLKGWIQCDADGNPIDIAGNKVEIPDDLLTSDSYKYAELIKAVEDNTELTAEEKNAKIAKIEFVAETEYIYNNSAIFARGTKIGTEDLYFFPVFEEIADVLTVKFYKEDGTTCIGETYVPYNEPLAYYSGAFEKDAYKDASDTHHFAIDKWVNVDGGAEVTNVTADISVKPTYTAVAHTKVIYELIQAPTCTQTGLAHMKCAALECNDIDYNVTLDVVPDYEKPEGQIYVGSDKWTFDNYTFGIDYTDVKYVGPNTNVIVNAEDFGTHNWNSTIGSYETATENAISKGVGKIEYYIADKVVNDPSTIVSWTNVYDYESVANDVLVSILSSKGLTLLDYTGMASDTSKREAKVAIDNEVKAILATYKANATGVLSNLNLENGKDYILYIKVSDREVNGQCRVNYFSSGKINYGTVAPEIAVAGDGYGTKFCAEATVTVTDDADGFKVYLDGEEVTLADSKFVCSAAGVHNVTVIDKNGNKSTKTFEIKGNHIYRNYTIAADCENAGSRYDLCILCGDKANETVIAALGHSYTVNYTEKASTCTDDGYRTYVCDNNCGEKLVLAPTSEATEIAKATKFVAAETEGEEGTWVALTVADLAHLKATGKHTYAKVKDENGEDTDVDAWVIDKAATCKVAGSKHRDCTVCGILGRETAEIALDTENGHKFYRAKIPVGGEPTCTEIGKKTQTCRYCGFEKTVEYLDALGHVAGEYVVTKEATCTEAGSKVLHCSRCDSEIAAPGEDGKIDPNGAADVKKIPALGHAWKLDGTIWQATETDAEAGIEAGKYYQNHVCGNDASHKKTKEVEGYTPPVAATVTFDFNGGYFEIPAVGNENELGYVPPVIKGTQTINAFVGEFIAAGEVKTAIKQNNATKTYTFSHWATKNADGTYTEVKFPIEVTAESATYYAVYAEKYINYTITYYKEDGVTEYKKTGYLHNGEEIKLADGPAKAETWQYSYTFAGWKVKGGNTVYTDKLTINGADIKLEATYTSAVKKYAVTYAYSSSDILETFLVEAGQSADACYIRPEKASDTKNHYTFTGWNKANQLEAVKNNIYTTPEFSAESHRDHITVTIKPGNEATCNKNAIETNTCSCGYSYDVEVAGSALPHIWGDSVYNAETGKNIVTCQREGCGVKQEDDRTFVVTFVVDGNDYRKLPYVAWGTKLGAADIPADPKKADDAINTYTFKGWKINDGTTVYTAKALADLGYAVKADTTITAEFEAKARVYTVTFLYDANNVISYKTVNAGESVTYAGAKPAKSYTDTKHYIFTGWKGYDAGVLNIKISNVQEDMRIYADFDNAEHTYGAAEKVSEANCQQAPGYKYTCTVCGQSYTKVTGKPVEHDRTEIDRVEPANGKDGYIKYECQNIVNGKKCGYIDTEVLVYEDNTIDVTVTVFCNGSPKSGIKVEIQSLGGDFVKTVTTNSNGVATAVADKDKTYVAYAEINGKKVSVPLTTDKDGNYVGSYSYEDSSVNCSCACHRNNIWGTIFRFFHKIIKLFTGEFKCCGNPDPKYGN